MWTSGAAIRPVPRFARIDAEVLASIEARLADDADDEALDAAFERFEQTQPALAELVSKELSRPLDETALALGYFLCITLWLAFDRRFGERLAPAEAQDVAATEEALVLEEQLRAERAEAPAGVDDVIAHEQPDAAAFVHAHVDAALEVDGKDAVDVADVDRVYRVALLVLLTLSYAVRPEPGDCSGNRELYA